MTRQTKQPDTPTTQGMKAAIERDGASAFVLTITGTTEQAVLMRSVFEDVFTEIEVDLDGDLSDFEPEESNTANVAQLRFRAVHDGEYSTDDIDGVIGKLRDALDEYGVSLEYK